ncbi:VOC family protein [Massilia sp.]|uniref:VOC family protein n=1 Tax=Massilia sp. TaxID=1882437 RepID=UPI0028AC1A19|nr:VOC family protein [Massilia sp.]
MSSEVKPVEEGMHTITPHLVCANCREAIEFYKKAFGAEEVMAMPMPDGKIGHAMLRIGDSPLFLADEFPDYGSFGPLALKGTPVTIHLSVPNVDAVWDSAVAAGAKVRMQLADQFWGDRYGQLDDPFGHRWSLAQHIRDVSPEEMEEAMKRECA